MQTHILIWKIRKLKICRGGQLTIIIEAIVIKVIDAEMIHTVDPGGSMIIIEVIDAKAIITEVIDTVYPGRDWWSS